jgi:starvation-inducible DNA-binding protein
MMRSPSPLPDDVREKSGERIGDIAIDLLGLATVARKAHWNVRGPLFGQLHDLFGKLYDACSAHADILAEHVAMLGLTVRGDHADVAKSAAADPIGDETDGIELASLIFDRTQITIAEIGDARSTVDELGNEDGCQLLCDASIAISKLGWMIGAYLEGEEEGPKTDKASRSVPPNALVKNDE